MESARTLATNAPSDVAAASCSQQQHNALPGKYKEFFRPEAQQTVRDWYYATANVAQRHAFKSFVKDILAFDVDAAERGLRPTYQSDLVSAGALVSHNGGGLMTDAARDKAVMYLSFQKRVKHQQFRETFGVIQPPTTRQLPITQTKTDFRPARVVGRVPTEEALYRSKPILVDSKIKKPSDVTTAPCEVLGPMGATAYGTMFPWKVAPKTHLNILQRAHQASVKGPPWGIAEAPDGHWVTHTREAFAGHEYRFDQNELLRELDHSAGPPVDKKKYVSGDGHCIGKRRFQNYNDNYCDALLHLDRQRRKGLVPIPTEQDLELSIRRRQEPAVQSAFARNSPAPNNSSNNVSTSKTKKVKN